MNKFISLAESHKQLEQKDIYHLDGFEPKYYINIYAENKPIERAKILISKRTLKNN